MTFKKWSIALFAIALVAPLSASALGISIVNVSYSGNHGPLMDNEDTVTIDLVLENAGGVEVRGLDVGVFGYDQGAIGSAADNNLVFDGAQATPGAFNTVFFSGINVDGLGNSTGVSESGNPVTFNERFVRLFGGVTTNTPAPSGDGTNDSGVAGNQTTPGGDVHFRVTFSAQRLGATTAAPVQVLLDFGDGQQGFEALDGAGNQVAFDNAQLLVTIVPEPGTALLMGLGLAGLATTRRR